MLKKHNKLIMLLVLVTFMFTIVGSAGAATTSSVEFPDVDAGTAEAAAIYRLAGLGILEGYPDGTFGADKTITRAEFAKIATYTAGLESVASGMTGVATGYPDVASDHWASGWINVATAQGFMKGYPDGSFGAEAQITQAEVITVLMRLLGYNDNLAGVWPSNYVSKAANLDVLDDVTFVSNQPATRGEVCLMASETLNCYVVEYVASDNLFANKADPNSVGPNNPQGYVYLLEQNFKDTTFTENALAMGFRHSSTDELQLVWFQYDSNQEKIIDTTHANGGFVNADVHFSTIAKSCVFAGGSILDVCEGFVEFDTNKDGYIISISIQNYGVIGPSLDPITPLDEVEVKNGKAIVDGNRYDFLNDASQVVLESVANPDVVEDIVEDTLIETVATARAGLVAAGITLGAAVTDVATAQDFVNAFDGALDQTIPALGVTLRAVLTNGTDAQRAMLKLEAMAVTDGVKNYIAAQTADKCDFLLNASGTSFRDRDAYDNSDVYKLIQNKNGKIAAVRAYSAPVAGIVERVSGDKIYYFDEAGAVKFDVGNKVYTAAGAWDGYDTTTNFADEDIFVMNNASEEITLADIQPLDAVTVQKGYRGYDYYLVVSTTKLPGTLQAYQGGDANTTGDQSKVMILDKYWNVLETDGIMAAVSLDGGKEFDSDRLCEEIFEEYDLWDIDVTAIMSAYGKIAALVFDDVATVSKNYGVVTEVSTAPVYVNNKSAYLVTVKKEDGQEYSYAANKNTKLKNTAGVYTKIDDLVGAPGVEAALTTANIDEGQLVSFSLTSAGDLNRIESLDEMTVAATNFIDTDGKLIKLDGKWYDATDMVAFGWKSNKASVGNWSQFKNAVAANADLQVKVSTNGKLQYALVNESLSSDGMYAVRGSAAYRQSSQWYLPFIGIDAVKADAATATNSPGSKGSVVRYTLDSNEIDDYNVLYNYSANSFPTLAPSEQGTFNHIQGSVLTVTPTNATSQSFRVDADTKFFDVKDNDKVATGLTASEFHNSYKNEQIVVWTASATGDVAATDDKADIARVVIVRR